MRARSVSSISGSAAPPRLTGTMRGPLPGLGQPGSLHRGSHDFLDRIGNECRVVDVDVVAADRVAYESRVPRQACQVHTLVVLLWYEVLPEFLRRSRRRRPLAGMQHYQWAVTQRRRIRPSGQVD